ncbi:hypothetical protein ONE63_006690 [Megalurothrips usitatus]|uniref:Uncharacterized protein n=1 Tax=Megalurothrips usitatus TaxID=439358 RepID=A0AAV7XWR6_9NEOP|nr:hypothetical protein ONE63_006690 [Megalurothrips usitatus]
MIKRAASSKIKLPPAFVQSVKASPEHSKQSRKPSRSGKEAALVAKKVSKQAQKQVACALEKVTKERMKDLIELHRTGVEVPPEAPKVTDDDAPCQVQEVKTDHHLTDASGSKTENGSEFTRLRRKRKVSGKAAEDSESDSGTSYVSSNMEKKLLQEKIDKLQLDLASERKKRRIAETDKCSAELKVQKWEAAFETFWKSRPIDPSPGGKTRVSPLQTDSRCQGVAKKLFNDDLQDQLCTAEKPAPVPSPVKSPLKSSSKAGVAAFTVTPIKSPPSPQKGKKSPSKSVGSITKNSPSTAKVSKKIKKKEEEPLGPDEKDAKSLAPIILSALQDKTLLEQNKENTKIHLGNNIFIKKSVWDTRIKKESVKLSIMVLDLAEEIWGYERCAQLSLTGGISPRTPKAAPKEAAPRGVVEVIKGVYRAKLIYQGMTNEAHINNAVAKDCLNSLRMKFRDSMRKLNSEKKK